MAVKWRSMGGGGKGGGICGGEGGGIGGDGGGGVGGIEVAMAVE